MAADTDYHASDSDPDIPSRSTSRRRKKENGKNGHINSSTVGPGYSWEDEYKRSWDLVQEDASGSLSKTVEELVTSSKRRRLLKDTTPLQRGIIRHLILILDLSSAMAEKDMRPTRYQLMITYSIDFVNEYFEQNPISQLGVLGMKDGKCFRITDLSGNPHDHILALQKLRSGEPSGDVSLLNSLSLAHACLHHVPAHATREILLVFGSLVSSDPGDIHRIIEDLVVENIKVRVIGLSAQVAICRELCRKTNNGDDRMYGVCLNELHFKDLLLETTIPPAEQKHQGSKITNGASLIMMGFPSRVIEPSGSLCSCHSQIRQTTYLCPRCSSKLCSLPAQCPCCSLTLILSTHLARSYHHLFPLENWTELSNTTEPCFSCLSVDSAGRFECPKCQKRFCVDCDVFCHEILHNCPGCEGVDSR